MAAILWGLGLSLASVSQVLGIFRTRIEKTTVWRDVQEAGQALWGRKRWPGVVRVVGEKGELIGVDILAGRDAQTFKEWLRRYVQGLGVEVVVTDDLATYPSLGCPLGIGLSVCRPVLEELGVEQQLCLAHIRKNLARRLRGIEGYEREKGKLTQIEDAAKPPMLASEPLGGARHVQISVCIRYKTMRGYKCPVVQGHKSQQGLLHGIALTQWLGSGARVPRTGYKSIV